MALLSGMHHFPPGVPERARRVHERLPAGSALCSSDVGVLIDRGSTRREALAGCTSISRTPRRALYISFRASPTAPSARSMESRFLSSSKAASGMRSLAPPSTSTAEAAFARGCSTASGARAAISNTTCPISGLLEARQRRVREERPQLAGCGPAAGRSENRAASRPERLKPAPQALRAKNKK